MKALHFIKEVLPNKKTLLHPLPAQYQQITRSPDFRSLSIKAILEAKDVVVKNPLSELFLKTEIVTIAHIQEGDHFGESSCFVAHYNLHKRRNESKAESCSENDWFGRNDNRFCPVTIVATDFCEYICITKIDFQVFFSFVFLKEICHS